MRASAARAMSSRSGSTRGIVLMIIAVGLLTVNDALAKYLAQRYPVDQVLALRHAAVLLAILPYAALVTGWQALKVNDWRGQSIRGVLFIAGTVFLVLSVTLLPLATVTSLIMTAPIFVALFSGLLLGERVNRARWLAIIGGFLGVLLIVRPGGHVFEWGLLLALAAALANGLRDLLTRRLARTETSIAQLFWSNAAVTVACFATFSARWQPVGGIDVAWFLGAGVLNALGHFVMIEAMRAGEAALIAPFRYTALIWAVVIGFLVWGDLPEVWVVLGALVIGASGIGMILMERKAWLMR
jgi:drug/metabolite transporter (DMT)-like permease